MPNEQPPPSARLPRASTVATLCSDSLRPTDLHASLHSLWVLPAAAGRWHLGERTGTAAASLGAFPAAFRALVGAQLVFFAEAPVSGQACE
jgi:hypothetical protein